MKSYIEPKNVGLQTPLQYTDRCLRFQLKVEGTATDIADIPARPNNMNTLGKIKLGKDTVYVDLRVLFYLSCIRNAGEKPRFRRIVTAVGDPPNLTYEYSIEMFFDLALPRAGGNANYRGIPQGTNVIIQAVQDPNRTSYTYGLYETEADAPLTPADVYQLSDVDMVLSNSATSYTIPANAITAVIVFEGPSSLQGLQKFQALDGGYSMSVTDDLQLFDLGMDGEYYVWNQTDSVWELVTTIGEAVILPYNSDETASGPSLVTITPKAPGIVGVFATEACSFAG